MKYSSEFVDMMLDEMGFEKNDVNRAAFFETLRIRKNVDDEVQKNGILPDTFGVDALFLSFFANEEMLDDLPWIIIDFCRHEANAVSTFSRVDYIEKNYDELDAFVKICEDGLNLIFNAFRDGNEYAKLTLQNLYKTYYSAEYRSFKRYNIIDIDGLDALANGDGQGQYNELIAARIFTMCQVFDKEIDRTAYYQFPILARSQKSFSEYVNQKAERPILEDLTSEDKEKLQAFLSYFSSKEGKALRHTMRLLTKNILQREGYYVASSDDDEMDLYYAQSYTVLRLLRFIKSKEEFSPRELLMLTLMSEKISDLTDVISDRDWFIDLMLAGSEPTNIKYPLSKVHSAQIPKKPAEVSTQKEPTNNREAFQYYMDELDRLRRELRRSEQEAAHFRQLYENEREALKEEKEIVEALKQEQTELYTLRVFAYQQTEKDLPSNENIGPETMIDQIRDKRILIIGGHPNWVYKFRNMFPLWRFIDPSPSGSIDSKIMDNTDCALFFTDIITHAVYYKYIAIAREKKVPFGYLHATNVDASIREMYRVIMGE